MRTVLITGANRGIGLALTQQYAADGWRVFATCREPAVAQNLNAVSGNVIVEALEIDDPHAVSALARSIDGEKIDLLFNNAGIAGREAGTLGSIDPDVWEQTFRINTIAPILMAEAFADNVARSEQKKMVFVTSMLGSIALNDSGDRYAYRSSKAALNMACKSLSVDLASCGITVAVLHPGHVRTDMGGASAPVTPEASAAGMRKVVAGLTPDDNGGFFNYDGQRFPW